MPVYHTPDSEYAKEMVKWEGQFSPFGPPGRPYVYREFPKAMFKAADGSGGPTISEHGTADSAEMQKAMEGRGWHASQEQAIAAVFAWQQQVAVAAAERNYTDRRMSDKAQREVAAAEAEHEGHMAVKPEAPIKRRGRPRKTVEVA